MYLLVNEVCGEKAYGLDEAAHYLRYAIMRAFCVSVHVCMRLCLIEILCVYSRPLILFVR